MKKALLERALNAELDEQLGYEKGDVKGRNSGNSRNRHGSKRVKGSDGEVAIDVPRDRDASFEPKIISMYAHGMPVREIQGHLHEIYGVDVSPDLISRVTDEVMDEVRSWQSRSLDEVYPIIIFDALRVKIRDGRAIKRCLACGSSRQRGQNSGCG